MAQSVEHVLGKDGVTSSNLVISSKKKRNTQLYSFFFIRQEAHVLTKDDNKV